MNDQRKWKIYKHKNKLNGKVYIGQTKQSPEKRFDKGYGYIGNAIFYNAIKKYGWDNFIHEILIDNIDTQEEANRLEREYIKMYNSTDRKYGYNIDSGGGANSIFYRKVYQYDLLGNYINEYDSTVIAEFETGIHCTSIGQNALGKRRSAGNFIWSYEKYDKLPVYYLKTKTLRVYQYDLLGNFVAEYDNAYEAGIQFGDYASHRIIEHCDSKKGDCFQYQWRYYRTNKLKPVGAYGKGKKAVYQYDINGNLLEIYPSAKIAADKYKVDRHAIAGCCRGVCKTSCGYYWSYEYKEHYSID